MKRFISFTFAFVFLCAAGAAASPAHSGRYSGAFAHPAAKESLRSFVMAEPELGGSSQTASGPTHSVVLTWNASPDAAANPALTYNAYRLTGACSSTATFTKINTAPIAAVTFTDANVAPGAYCYYVTAALNGIESVPSNQAAAAILVLPPGSVVLSAK